MHAGVANQIVCAEPGPCCQPGTVSLLMAVTDDYGLVELEFCEEHARRRRPQPATLERST